MFSCPVTDLDAGRGRQREARSREVGGAQMGSRKMRNREGKGRQKYREEDKVIIRRGIKVKMNFLCPADEKSCIHPC